jgi:hypothetical protein
MLEALIGALVGGLTSGLAAWLVVQAQLRAARVESDHYARKLFQMLVGEQGSIIQTMIDEHTRSGNIWLRLFDESSANYEIFQRNKEFLIRIEPDVLRSDVLKAMHDMQSAIYTYKRHENVRWIADQEVAGALPCKDIEKSKQTRDEANSTLAPFRESLVSMRGRFNSLHTRLALDRLPKS